MQVGESVAVTTITDIDSECPFDHELEKPPEIKNELKGKGSQLATNMGNGTSTNTYKLFTPDKESNKRGILPQKDKDHEFYRQGTNKGRCLQIDFSILPGSKTDCKNFPVSSSAHHLIPSQEALKVSPLLEYMCKKGAGKEHNHGFAGGKVWSDAGYNTNGSENGTYLPGSYAVGGGRGGLKVWHPIDEDKDEEHDDDYIYADGEKLPAAEFRGFELHGKDKDISVTNPCWVYVSKATDLAGGHQFHDRHVIYSKDIVAKALNNIHKAYKFQDVTLRGSCPKCKEKLEQIKKQGLPTPYAVVDRLEFLSNQLRGYLTAGDNTWRPNIFTSRWMDSYMQIAQKDQNKASELYVK